MSNDKRAAMASSVAGYAAIRDAIGTVQHHRGASSTPTELYADLPPRFDQGLRQVRKAIELHAELTERQEAQVLHALRASRSAEAASHEAAQAVLVVPNLAQEVASVSTRLEHLRHGTDLAVRSLSRWWTATIVLGLINVVTTLMLLTLVAWLVLRG